MVEQIDGARVDERREIQEIEVKLGLVLVQRLVVHAMLAEPLAWQTLPSGSGAVCMANS
jgi:hypothetical protein